MLQMYYSEINCYISVDHANILPSHNIRSFYKNSEFRYKMIVYILYYKYNHRINLINKIQNKIMYFVIQITVCVKNL